MYAYLGYLYWLAEGWSKPGSVLSQIRVSWNMGFLEGMKWMEWMASHLNLFGLHNLQLEIESGLLSFFLKKITPLSFADISWILWSFEWEAFVEWTVVFEKVIAGGGIAGKSGCQYPELMTDRPVLTVLKCHFHPSTTLNNKGKLHALLRRGIGSTGAEEVHWSTRTSSLEHSAKLMLFPSIRFSFLGLERLLDWTTFTGMFPATCSGSQLGFLQGIFKRGSGLPMVLSSLSKCLILTYGREIWPSSFYL